MTSKYCINNLIFVVINDNKYAFYKHVTEKMHIFNVINDVKLKNDECINISCDTSTEIIEYMLDILRENKIYINNVISIAHLIKVISLMKYFTTDPEIIQNASKKYLKKLFYENLHDSRIDYIMECFNEGNILCHSEIEYVLKILMEVIEVHEYDGTIFNKKYIPNVMNFIKNFIQKPFSFKFKYYIVEYIVRNFIYHINIYPYDRMEYNTIIKKNDEYHAIINRMKKIHDIFGIKNEKIFFSIKEDYIKSVSIADYIEEMNENCNYVHVSNISIRYIFNTLLKSAENNI
jgi:hypothetical protein